MRLNVLTVEIQQMGLEISLFIKNACKMMRRLKTFISVWFIPIMVKTNMNSVFKNSTLLFYLFIIGLCYCRDVFNPAPEGRHFSTEIQPEETKVWNHN